MKEWSSTKFLSEQLLNYSYQSKLNNEHEAKDYSGVGTDLTELYDFM